MRLEPGLKGSRLQGLRVRNPGFKGLAVSRGETSQPGSEGPSGLGDERERLFFDIAPSDQLS